jgi:hypothetical protein
MFRLSSATTVAVVVAIAALAPNCGRVDTLEEIPIGSEVTITTDDGRRVSGTLAEISIDDVVVESDQTGTLRHLSREAISAVRRRWDLSTLLPARSIPIEVTVPMNTTVPIDLETALRSNGSWPEDVIRAHTAMPITVGETVALPMGSEVRGVVLAAEALGSNQGGPRLVRQFTNISAFGQSYDIATEPIAYGARGTRGEDTTMIGSTTARGFVSDGIAGRSEGVAVGSAIETGPAVVPTAPSQDIELRMGQILQLRLLESLTVRVPDEGA